MGGGHGASLPPIPPPPALPPLQQNPQGMQAAETQKRRAQAAYGAGATIATSSEGLTTQPMTTGKSLLGQ